MAKKVGNYQIPFDEKGNQLHYPVLGYRIVTGAQKYVDVSDYRDNTPFMDTLTFVDFNRGRSAAYSTFKRENGMTVCVFLKEMSEMLPRMIEGKITGKFAFVKRGKNYGCTLQD
jgi:hypothetical protein